MNDENRYLSILLHMCDTDNLLNLLIRSYKYTLNSTNSSNIRLIYVQCLKLRKNYDILFMSLLCLL